MLRKLRQPISSNNIDFIYPVILKLTKITVNDNVETWAEGRKCLTRGGGNSYSRADQEVLPKRGVCLKLAVYKGQGKLSI